MATREELRLISQLLAADGLGDFRTEEITPELRRELTPDEERWFQPPGDPYKYQFLSGGRQIATFNTRTGKRNLLETDTLRRSNPAFFENPVVQGALTSVLEETREGTDRPATVDDISVITGGTQPQSPTGPVPVRSAPLPGLTTEPRTAAEVNAPKEGFLSRLGYALSLPAVQRSLGQFAIAIGGPESVGGRMGQAAIQGAEDESARVLFGRLAAGDTLEEALKDPRVQGISRQTVAAAQMQAREDEKLDLEERRIAAGEAETDARVNELAQSIKESEARLEQMEKQHPIDLEVKKKQADYYEALAKLSEARASGTSEQLTSSFADVVNSVTALHQTQSTLLARRAELAELINQQQALKAAAKDDWSAQQNEQLLANVERMQQLERSISSLDQLAATASAQIGGRAPIEPPAPEEGEEEEPKGTEEDTRESDMATPSETQNEEAEPDIVSQIASLASQLLDEEPENSADIETQIRMLLAKESFLPGPARYTGPPRFSRLNHANLLRQVARVLSDNPKEGMRIYRELNRRFPSNLTREIRITQ